MPTCWIIAGPNGAGKTTFAFDFLPNIAACSRFINADSIAAGLSPLSPESKLASASRLFLKEIGECIDQRVDFAFETTLAGRSYLKLIDRLQSDGWRVELLYLALPEMKMSLLRVAERVKHGGHDIPSRDIERRFPRSLYNLLYEFSHRADEARCFMNIGDVPKLVFHQIGRHRTVYDQSAFQLLNSQAKP